MRKGDGYEAKLKFAGHAKMENRRRLCVLWRYPAARRVGANVTVKRIAELQQRGITTRTVGDDRILFSAEVDADVTTAGAVVWWTPRKSIF